MYGKNPELVSEHYSTKCLLTQMMVFHSFNLHKNVYHRIRIWHVNLFERYISILDTVTFMYI